jgi:probable HAF family extracellular repeat protein
MRFNFNDGKWVLAILAAVCCSVTASARAAETGWVPRALLDLGTVDGHADAAYFATGINSKNEVVGYYTDPDSSVGVFKWTPNASMTDGKMANLGSLGNLTTNDLVSIQITGRVMFGVNTDGVIVGVGKRVPGLQLNAATYAPNPGFLWGTADNFSQATAVNEAGRVVGQYMNGNLTTAFIQTSSAQGDARVALPAVPTGGNPNQKNPAWAYAINNTANVSIAGCYQDSSDLYTERGAIWTKNAMGDYVLATAPKFNEDSVRFYGINDAGKAVGLSPDLYGEDNFQNAVLWDGSESSPVTSLNTPFPAHGTAYGINNEDLIVGTASTPDGIDQAVVWKGDGHTMLNLNDYLSAYIGDGNTFESLSQAFAVNDYNGGAVVGYGIRDGHVRAFIATPEPATWVMLIAGLGAAALLRARAKRK